MGGFVSDLTGFIVARVNRTSLDCVDLGQSGSGVTLSYPITGCKIKLSHKARIVKRNYHAKILIVDDDVGITELMKALVSMGGHQPTTVNDSTKAIEAANSVNPDLITLDLMMPGLTGFELCELLHKDPKFANTPIVIISARDDSESKEKALEAGANDFLSKPFGVNDLMQKIKALTN